jgi:hypothetical protein
MTHIVSILQLHGRIGHVTLIYDGQVTAYLIRYYKGNADIT